MNKNATNGSWLKKHRNQLAVHSLVLVAFLLYCIFLAESVSDRLERIPGESTLRDFLLPAVANRDDIQCYVDSIKISRHATEISGWAFIKDQGSERSEAYLVLKSDDNTYIFDTSPLLRPDVTTAFKDLNLNLDRSGYHAMIPLRKIANGKYVLGIYIKKGSMEAFKYTDRTTEF